MANKVLDRNDGVEMYYSKFVENSKVIVFENLKNTERVCIAFCHLTKESKDSRPVLISIAHFVDGKKRQIHYCLDLTGHIYDGKRPFHINLTGLSKNCSCALCGRYFTKLDHLTVPTKEGMGNYKFINYSELEAIFLKKLEKLGFDIEFQKVGEQKIYP